MSNEKKQFKAEVNQLLNLVINSLYSHKEIFLRELVSNASDALEKVRFESLTRPELAESDSDWKITLTVDKTLGTLTISDNGIGLTRDEAVRELGTIAHSGTLEYLKALKEKGSAAELIGQFGVGFYSAFMVADRVVVYSRKAGEPANRAVRWESEARGTYTVEEVEKAGRGTDVVLHLKEEAKQYLSDWELRTLVRKYSDFVEFPIVMDVEREEEDPNEKGKTVKVVRAETLNSQKALWLKDKSEITADEYNEFYQHLSRDFEDPLKVIHYRAEGTMEFSALLFIPGRNPFDLFFREEKTGPMLYVRRVQIMPHCEELLPTWLRFVKGVVDSSDLPLNVSREMLQNNRQVDLMHRNLVKKVLEHLGDLKRDEFEKYVKFHEQFGRILKEGVHLDHERRETVADLLLFRSTHGGTGSWTTLADYISRMPEGQKDIYYLAAPSLEEAVKSPYLERFVQKGREVLLLSDEIDEIVFHGFTFKEKPFKAVNRDDADPDPLPEEEKKKLAERFAPLVAFVKETLGDAVKEVRLSTRLTDTPCVVVGEGTGMDPFMEQLLKRAGKGLERPRPNLELNPDHPVTAALERLREREEEKERLQDCIRLLFDQAVVVKGDRPADPGAALRLAGELIVRLAD